MEKATGFDFCFFSGFGKETHVLYDGAAGTLVSGEKTALVPQSFAEDFLRLVSSCTVAEMPVRMTPKGPFYGPVPTVDAGTVSYKIVFSDETGTRFGVKAGGEKEISALHALVAEYAGIPKPETKEDRPAPADGDVWNCPACGAVCSGGKFCGACGGLRPR